MQDQHNVLDIYRLVAKMIQKENIELRNIFVIAASYTSAFI
jgi:hypothetical protein